MSVNERGSYLYINLLCDRFQAGLWLVFVSLWWREFVLRHRFFMEHQCVCVLAKHRADTVLC